MLVELQEGVGLYFYMPDLDVCPWFPIKNGLASNCAYLYKQLRDMKRMKHWPSGGRTRRHVNVLSLVLAYTPNPPHHSQLGEALQVPA